MTGSMLLVGLPWAGALLIPLLRRDQHRGLLALLCSAAAFLVALNDAARTMTNHADGLGIFLALVATGIGSLTLLYSLDYMQGRQHLKRYYALILIFIGAMCGLVLAESLLFLLVCWELTALCSCALIAFDTDQPAAVAGGLRALVITQLGGVGLLAGILLSRAETGTDSLYVFLSLTPQIDPTTLAWIAFAFLIAAAAKSAQVPFHLWLPGAMEAPSPVSALIHAATMVNAGVYLVARFAPAFDQVPGWSAAVTGIGILSALLGAVLALGATDLKRALAYSTISQLGLLFYAVGCGASFAAQYHLLNHAVFKALLFLSAGALIHAAGTRQLDQLRGRGQQMPFIRLTFIVGSLALMGIPFANGFWSKELILETGLERDPFGWALMTFSAGLTGLYTMRLVWLVFLAPTNHPAPLHSAPALMRLTLGLLAAASLTTWMLSEALGTLLESESGHAAELSGLFSAPATWFVLGVVVFSSAAYLLRERIGRGSRDGAARLTVYEAGSGPASALLVRGVHTAAQALDRLHYGPLNANLAAVLGGVLLLIALVWLGGGQ